MSHTNSEPRTQGMSLTNLHARKYTLMALDEAIRGRGFCAPNPAVGAVIMRHGVSCDEVVSAGYHHGFGKPHAEVEAIRLAESILGNRSFTDCTLFVTLEPCCHSGKTPPCTELIIEKGFKNVVFSMRDPNPKVNGNGRKALEKAGLTVTHQSEPEIDGFYESYLHWHKYGSPFTTAKLALSLDGKIAGKNHERVFLTGEKADQFTHEKRYHSDAILTSARTITIDNPRLNARTTSGIFSKPIYLIDRRLTVSPNAEIFRTADTITIFHQQGQLPAWTHPKAKFVGVEESSFGRLSLQSILDHIGSDGIHDLWIEVGSELISQLLREKLVQRGCFIIAPHWLGKDALEGFCDDVSEHILSATRASWRAMDQDMLLELRW